MLLEVVVFVQNYIKLSAGIHEFCRVRSETKKILATVLKTILPSLPRAVIINEDENPTGSDVSSHVYELVGK